MNFIFVIDTSTSMLQTFDESFSFIDSAKNAVEKFVKSNQLFSIEREENSLFKDKDKEDRYLLLSTNEQDNVISKWDDPLDHFLFQLKIISVKQ